MTETIAYLVQANRSAPLLLAVMDPETGFHTYELSILNASRLAAECSEAVNAALGGLSHKFSMQEMAAELSKLQARKE